MPDSVPPIVPLQVQNGDALKDKEDYRKKDDSDEKALNMFGVGVSLLKSSMRSLDAITKQQRQQRYVAPWVKHQAMQVWQNPLATETQK